MRFWDLKWSELGLVAGPRVRAAMEVVGDDLYNYKKNESRTKLHIDIASLVQAMKESLLGTWNIDPNTLK